MESAAPAIAWHRRVRLCGLVGHWLDLYLMIFPSSVGPVLGVLEIGMSAGAVGLFGLLFFRALQKAPALADSLYYHRLSVSATKSVFRTHRVSSLRR